MRLQPGACRAEARGAAVEELGERKRVLHRSGREYIADEELTAVPYSWAGSALACARYSRAKMRETQFPALSAAGS